MSAGASGDEAEAEAGPGSFAVVSVTGDVDVATAPALQQRLEAAIDSSPQVVVDLSPVQFLDSSGLGALVWGLKRARARGGCLQLVLHEPRVRRMFELTGLSRTFEIFPTLALAGSPRRVPSD